MSSSRPSVEAERYRMRLLQRIVVTIGQKAGFTKMEGAALNCLVEILEQYFENLLIHTHTFAEIAGRTRPNLNDAALLLSHSHISIPDITPWLEQKPLPSEQAPIIPYTSDEAEFFDTKPEDLVQTLLGPNELHPNVIENPDESGEGAGDITTSTVIPEKHFDSYKLSQQKAEQSRIIEENLKNFMVNISNQQGGGKTTSEGSTNPREAPPVPVKREPGSSDLPGEADKNTTAQTRFHAANVYPIANYQRTPWKRARTTPSATKLS
ncbi:hypothetical protein H4R33_000997 [Dimargaris cristalligena]|nr:hypothetical protein H4R33_000997 [Dimargaris cristalligena]